MGCPSSSVETSVELGGTVVLFGWIGGVAGTTGEPLLTVLCLGQDGPEFLGGGVCVQPECLMEVQIGSNRLL